MSYANNSQDSENEGMSGVRVAIVTDNKDPENLGRVKLRYPWRAQADESDWARVATEMTGNDYGTYFLPEVEDEVLVGFENGDIHHPIVLGALWSGKRKPPEDNADGKNDVRTIVSRSGHRIDLDDTDGAGVVRIETSGGHTIVLDDSGGSKGVTVEDSSGNSISMDANSGEVSITAGQKLSLSAQTIELKADREMKLESTGTTDISGAQTSVTGNAETKIESSGMVKVNGSGMVEVRGGLIRLN